MSLQTGGRSGTWSGWLGLLLVVVFFCGPLFIGLRSWDIRNDEAIYDYASCFDGVLHWNGLEILDWYLSVRR